MHVQLGNLYQSLSLIITVYYLRNRKFWKWESRLELIGVSNLIIIVNTIEKSLKSYEIVK